VGTVVSAIATAGAGKLATSLVKGAEVAEVAETAAQLATRAEEIHGALDPIAQTMRTTAVAEVSSADGAASTVVSSSRNTLSPAQRAVLKPGETAVKGAGHAEETILNNAAKNGQKVNSMGVSRTPCASCTQKLKDAGVVVQGPN
jgi:deoxycytidylate deaminase